MRDPQSIVITGASSGIGAALAKAYAGPGIHLALTGRNRERLDGVAETFPRRQRSATAARTTASSAS